MAKLLGFQKPKKTGGTSTDQMLRILEKTYLNRVGGEFSNEEQIDGFLNTLRSMPQSSDVMEKVADLENKKLQIKSKQNDMMYSKSLFEDNLNDALRLEARNNYNNVENLVSSYLNVYADAEDKIDQYISDNVYKKYGTSAAIPQDILDLKNKIKDKAKYYSTLNTFLNIDGGEKRINTAGLAVKVDTNPISGNIISIDVVPRTELSSEYMGTDIKAKMKNASVPIYINAQSAENTSQTNDVVKVARLGDINFRGVKKLSGNKTDVTAETKTQGEDFGIGELKAQNEHMGPVDWVKSIFTDTPEEIRNDSLDVARKDGINLDNFKFDGNDIQNGSVVRKGNKLYYVQANGDMSEFDGKTMQERQENAQKYLSQIGEDVNKINTPKYAGDEFFISKDGSYRVKNKIGADYFQASTPTQNPAAVFSPTVQNQQTDNGSLNIDSTFFGDRINRQNKPDANIKGASTTAIDSGAATSESMISKAIGFFKNKVNK